MERYDELLLDALRAALRNETVDWEDVTPEEFGLLYRRADMHHVFPLVYSAVRGCPAAGKLDPAVSAQMRTRTMQQITAQILKADALDTLYKKLADADCAPLVVKGAVCRALYPQPDLRVSGDEDLLTAPELFGKVEAVFLENGLVPAGKTQDREKDYEVSYWKPGSPLYIELHRSLFSPQSEAVGDLNQFFADCFDRAETIRIGKAPYRTLCPTDHLLFLILHAFKHFLHSGFGIRQVADICLYAARYESRLDWNRLGDCCRTAHALGFTAAVFAIGSRHLGLTVPGLPEEFSGEGLDEMPMLCDLLQGGVYGTSSATRSHSSNITLKAVAEDKKGGTRKGSLRSSLFLPASALEHRFPYLKKRPWLLPVAWVSRVAKYGKENSVADAKKSMQLGQERIALLRTYGVISQDSE